MQLWHKRGIVVAAIFAVNATACVPPTRVGPDRQEQSWITFLGAPGHDVSAAETLNPDPRPLWKTVAGRAVRGSAAIGESVIAVGSVDRNIVLLDRATGQIFWRSHLPGTLHGGPLLDADRLYAATEATPEGKVVALRLRDGRIMWSRKTGSVVAPLAFDGAELFAGTEVGLVLRLDPDQGAVAWRRQLSGAIRAAPVVTPDGLVIATTNDTLYLLDRATGAITAKLATPGTVLAGAAYGQHRVYAGTTAGHILAIDLPALTVAWDQPAGDGVLGAPALVHDTVFALTRAGVLWMIPAAGPAGAASRELGIVARAGPTPTASGVLVASVSGEVLLVDRADGKVLWRAQLDGPVEEAPIVRDRTLVVIGGRGDIHTYR
jgi:outer membrane protein assembly factor BamB